MFEDFSYVWEEFFEEADVTIHHHEVAQPNKADTKDSHCTRYGSDYIDTNPIEENDENGILIMKKCEKCQLQYSIKNNRSKSINSGDENKTVDELKELRICSHGS